MTLTIRFQSLIGTIKTFPNATILKIRNEFQSLIGTIKTNCNTQFESKSRWVSIPYRDDKNGDHLHSIWKQKYVSIPYRDDKNTR